MKNIFLTVLTLFFLSSTVCHGQQKADSLKMQQIDSLTGVAIQFVCRDLAKSDSLIDAILSQSAQYYYAKGSALAYKFRGTNNICLGRNDSAVHYLNLSLKFFDTADEQEQYVRTLNNLAVAYKNQGKLDSAIKVFDRMVSRSRAHKLARFESYGLGGKASLYLETGDDDSVVYYGLQSLKIAEKIQDSVRMGSALMDLASAFLQTKDFDQALNYYNEALIILTAIQDEFNLASLYYNLGGIYMEYAKFDSAIHFMQKGVELAGRTNNFSILAFAYQGLGESYLREGDPDKAILYNRKALARMEELQNTLNKAEAMITLANAYIDKQQADSALYFAEQALELSEKQGFLNEKAQAYLHKSKAYKITGDADQAFENYVAYDSLDNLIINQQKDSVISDLRVKYETDKLEAEKVILNNRAELAEAESRQSFILFLSALVIAILIILAAVFYNSRLKQKKKAELVALELKESQKRLALEKQYRDSELKALKAQMNPHFIFNVLNSIQEFIVLNQKDMASDYLATFAELIRSYLHYSSEGKISIADEIDTLNKYMELESLRFEEKLTYSIELEDEVLQDQYIPTMVIQPFVENAVKHGLFNKPKDQRLRVSIASYSEKLIKVEIEDNGIGREKARALKDKRNQIHKSFAMEATQNRLDLLNEKFENKIGVEIIDLTSAEGEALGTKVILVIPTLS